MLSRIMAVLAALTLCLVPLSVAHAQFGGIVYDPRNHAQNLLTAARTLQQINNQVRQLANEARLLAYQAESLAGLPTSVAGELQASIAEIDALVQSARGLAYEIAAIERAYGKRGFNVSFDAKRRVCHAFCELRQDLAILHHEHR